MVGRWRRQRERGSPTLLRFMCWLGLRVGWWPAQILITPISLYFMVFSVAARRASQKYLTEILGRQARFRDVFRHYYTFSSTILDRVFFLSGRLGQYDITFKGLELIDEQAKEKGGFILLGSHIGSFDALHSLGAERADFRIKALMQPGNSKVINTLRNTLNPGLAADIIELGSSTAMLEAKEHLDSGGVVGILGDRVSDQRKAVLSTFLGKPALFPSGPVVLAHLLKVPVFLMFGIYKGSRSYEIHFENFADQISIGRESRLSDQKIWIDRYAERLEHYCYLAPFNWFNFYDFWDQEHVET